MTDNASRLSPLHPWIAHKIGCPPGTLTREIIAAYQLQRLRETLHLARVKSSFYQKKLANFPPDIVSLDELKQYPFTTAEDISREPLQFLCVSQNEIERVVTLGSSGTTGQPKRLFFTRGDQELTIDFFQAGMSTFTEPGDRVLILLPVERPGSVGDLLATALQRMGATSIRHGLVQDTARTLTGMAEEGVNVLVGVPTQVLALVRQEAAKRIHLPRLKSTLLTMDHVPQAIVSAVEEAWGCKVYNHYGTTEMGLGGGVECQARRGYHLREADLYIEVVDPKTGRVVNEGNPGEVVFTTLTRRGMPLIRYRTGDLSRFIPGDCACGTVLKTMEKVRSRISDMVALGNDHFLTVADLDDAVFSVDGVWNFTASVSRDGKTDHLQVEAYGAAETKVSAVQQALEAIPAVRVAQGAGYLDVVSMVRKQGLFELSGPAKRVIVDRRTLSD